MRLRWLVLVLLGLIPTLLVTTPTLAADTRSGESVVVADGESISDDLYVRANSVTINGTVHGDLIALAQRVVIDGRVDGDVLAVAHSLSVAGDVGGSIRAAVVRMDLLPEARVTRDVLVAGYSLTTAPDTVIQDDLRALTYQALLAGAVQRDYVGRHMALEIDGSIDGSATADVGPPDNNTPFNPAYVLPGITDLPSLARGTHIGRSASIDGDLRQPTPTAQLDSESDTNQQRVADWLRTLVPLVLAGAILIRISPAWLERAAASAARRPTKSLAQGGVVVAGGLVIAFCLLVLSSGLGLALGTLGLRDLAVVCFAVGFLTIGGLLSALYVSGVWLSQIVFGLALASYARQPAGLIGIVFVTVVGVIVGVASSITLIGGLIRLVVALVGVGGLAGALSPNFPLHDVDGVHSVTPRMLARSQL